jgi:hypothetical protein
VQVFLIPGINQVGAMSESLGFPVLSGHAHPFRMMAPFIFFHEEQDVPITSKAGGFFSFFTFIYYIPNQQKMARRKICVGLTTYFKNAIKFRQLGQHSYQIPLLYPSGGSARFT